MTDWRERLAVRLQEAQATKLTGSVYLDVNFVEGQEASAQVSLREYLRQPGPAEALHGAEPPHRKGR